MSAALKRRRKIQPDNPQIQTWYSQSEEKTTSFHDLSRYRVSPRLRLLIGPVTDPQNDIIKASDIMEQAPIDPPYRADEAEALETTQKEIIVQLEKDLKTVLPKDSMQVNKASVLILDEPTTFQKKSITITPDVKVTFDLAYLIRRNGEIVGHCDDLQTALSILNRIAINEVKARDVKGAKVFRRDLKDGKEIQICVQSVGLWNGSVKKELILDTLPVPIGE